MLTCRACGATAPDDARFCPTCGSALAAGPPPPRPEAPPPAWAPAPAPLPGPPLPPGRPLGVTILSLLYALLGLMLLLGGLLLLVAGPLVAEDPDFQRTLREDLGPELAAQAQAFLPVIGAVVLGVGAVVAALAYGTWAGRAWAWPLGLVLIVLSALSSVASLLAGDAGSVLSLLLDGFLVWYYLQAGVQRWFGRGGPPTEPGLPGYVPPPPGPPGF